MSDLDETTLRTHLRRRSGRSLEPAILDRLVKAIREQVRLNGQTSLPRTPALPPLRARLGLAAALVIAISLFVIPIAGGPSSSTPPSAGSSATTSVAASTPDPDALQVLSLDELQRVVALGDTEPYRDHIVVADVNLRPDEEQPPCVLVAIGGTKPPDFPVCRVDGFVVGADPPIDVVGPAEDTDIVRPFLPNAGMPGPVILRVRRENTVELIGEPPTVVGRVDWTVPSLITAVDNMPRTLEFAPNRFTVGPPFVVDAKLATGPGLFCSIETPSSLRISEFACGMTGWLAPADVPDPNTIIEGWSSRPSDWVRVQNGAYQRYGLGGKAPDSTPATPAMRGFYLVFPVIKYNATLCFECDAGAVAILYARLEPVAIP